MQGQVKVAVFRSEALMLRCSLTLEINRHQDDGCDLPAGSRIILRSHRLARILDMRDPSQPEGQAAQVDEEAEQMMARHDACYRSPACENRARRCSLLIGGLPA